MSGAALNAIVDAGGAVVSADPRLMALHEGAGGRAGGTLAVPGIAAVVGLSRRLGIAVARPVLAAEGDRTLDLWVRAVPEGQGTRVEVSGWAERPAPRPEPRRGPQREEDFLRAEADWRWEVDGRLAVTALSPAAAAALPGPATDFVGQPLTRLFSLKEDADGALPLLDAVAAARRFEGQIASIRGGSGGLYRLSGVPMTDGGGKLAGFRGAATRIEGRAVEPAQGGLGPGLDAVLREPLARIIAAAEALVAAGAGATPQYASYGADIAGAGRHLLALVDDLADLSAIEGPGFRPDAEPVDLADAARRAAGLLNVRAAECQVRIDVPPTDKGLVARGDFRRILQILVNLIGNAVRYSPPGSAVWLRAEREGDMAQLVVADQGKGIAPEHQARIFERFERVDTSEPGGTGLGLTISRRLARAMGGDVTVESAPGQGARFTLTLPVA